MESLNLESLVELAKQMKNQGLIFFASVVLIGLLILVGALALDEINVAAVVAACSLFAVLVVAGLAGMYLYHRQQIRLKRVDDQVAEVQHQAQEKIAIMEKQLEEQIARREEQLRQRPMVVSPNDYFTVLREWNDSGPGCVLLYNIELQSFRHRDILERTWGKIAKLEHIKKVVLLLPKEKVARWERVVLKESQQGGFFADPGNRKFDICDVPEAHPGHEHAGAAIAFAMYRRGDNPVGGDLHPKVAVFVLAEPFSNLREPYAEGDEAWWDYHHILIFGDDSRIRENAGAIWSLYYNPSRSRDVDAVLTAVEPLRPISPEEFFDQIAVRGKRREELLKHLRQRTVQKTTPHSIALDEPVGEFEICYDCGESICGHYSGLDCETRSPCQALVCVGGFTEYRHSRLLEMFEAELAKESVIQFFYEVSPEIEYITLTAYMEDMRAILDYVNSQRHAVVRNRLVLVARSINGFLAPLVASGEPYREMLAGLILIAPVFDVIEMMDNYRALHGDTNVRVENLWRRQTGYNDGAEWETRGRDPGNPARDWLSFFNHHVSLAVVADIVRQVSSERFRLRSFIDSVGLLSQHCPIYILSNPDDPVTGSKRAISALTSAAQGTGKIRSDYFEYIPIQSSHELRAERDAYPWQFRQEAQETREALRRMFTRLGIRTIQAPAT